MKRILFVDDDANFLAGLKALLRKHRARWEPHFAPGGREAVALLEAQPFDIVVSDMRMPGMNGAQVLEEAQRLRPEAVRVIFSGYSELSSVLQAARTAHQFLTKPCPPEQLTAAIERIEELQRVLTSEPARRCVSRLNVLPALPDVFARIIEELQRPEPDMKRLGRLVSADVNLYATLLKMVNSSFFGLSATVSAPERVVSLLGTDILKGLVLGAHVLNRLERGGFTLFSLEGLWSHCFRVAQFARIIARSQGEPARVQELCYSAGLLHDLGKFILAQEMPDEYAALLGRLQEGGRSLLELEREVLDVSHGEVGGYLLGLWGIGPEVVQAVFDHHDMGRAGPGFTPAAAVHAADWIDHQQVVLNPGFVFPGLDRDALDAAGLHERIDDWWRACAAQVEKWDR